MLKSVEHLKKITINDEWITPPDVYAAGILKSGIKPDLDVAATQFNKKCIKYFDANNSALDQDWNCKSGVFCNPPYSLVDKFVAKAVEQNQKLNIDILMLTFAKTDTSWFNKYVYSQEREEWLANFIPIQGRIKFLDQNGKIPSWCTECKLRWSGKAICQCGEKTIKSSAPYPSCWIIFRKNA